MNIAVYVSSNYSNYDEFSKLLPKYLGKYTQSPVLLTAMSPSTKDGHGNKMVKRYADEHKLRCKVYETEWNRFRRSAGSISSYHLSHNSEHSIVFWDGLSRGCKNLLQMAVRLNRPCDLVKLNPSAPNVNLKEEPKTADTTTTQPTAPTPATPRVGTTPRMPTTPSVPTAPSAAPSPSAPSTPSTPSVPTAPSAAAPNGSAPTAGTTSTAPNGTVAATQNGETAPQPPTDAIGKEFVKNTTTAQPSTAQQPSQNTQGDGAVQQPSAASANVPPPSTTATQTDSGTAGEEENSEQ